MFSMDGSVICLAVIVCMHGQIDECSWMAKIGCLWIDGRKMNG